MVNQTKINNPAYWDKLQNAGAVGTMDSAAERHPELAGWYNSLKAFESLFGTYRGFIPTDESPTRFGELEIVIDKENMAVRAATGLRVSKTRIPLSCFNLLTDDDLTTAYGSTIKNSYPGLVGFRLPGGMDFLFNPKPITEIIDGREAYSFGLLVRGDETADYLGETILFNPAQVAAGVYDTVVRLEEEEFGQKSFPTLSAGGKLPK